MKAGDWGGRGMGIANGSIRRKLLTFYGLAGIVPLVLVVLLCLHFASEALLTKSFQQLTAIQTLRKTRIEQNFALRVDTLKRLNQRNDVINLFDEINALPTLPGSNVIDVLSQQYHGISDRYTPSLRHFLASYNYADLLLISTEGRILYSLNYPHQAGALLASGALMDSSLSHLWQRISVTRQTAMIDSTPIRKAPPRATPRSSASPISAAPAR